jgi:hypothetical protein
MLEMRIKATGTVRERHTRQCPFMPSRDFKKEKKHDFCEFFCDKANKLHIVEQKGNKTVTADTNFSTVNPIYD